MNSMRRFLVGAAFAGLTAGAVAQPAAGSVEGLAAGTWYGEFTAGPAQPMQRFLTTRNLDGTFTVRARFYEKGKATQEVRNGGRWGVSNGLYFTVTTQVEGADPKSVAAVNAYHVYALTPEAFEYQHINGARFRVIRVDPANARLPD